MTRVTAVRFGLLAAGSGGKTSTETLEIQVPIASPLATSSLNALLFSSAASSLFAPPKHKHEQSPFASRYGYPPNPDHGWEREGTSASASPTGQFCNGCVKWMGEGRGWSGFLRRKASQNEGEEDDAIGGTLRPHAHGHVQAQGTRRGNGSRWALPVPPDADSASTYGYGYTKVHVGALDPGVTGWDHLHIPVL
ncbi:hypothetical protein K438DRAFT_1783743 [Mycena galopus ATCC 62051]|nr:hypothetical protein K438DRAFT_1783743 [Mycena galopus ATCC 62051]